MALKQLPSLAAQLQKTALLRCSSTVSADFLSKEMEVLNGEMEGLFGSAPTSADMGGGGQGAEIGVATPSQAAAPHREPRQSSSTSVSQDSTVDMASPPPTKQGGDPTSVQGLPAPVVNITYNIHIHHHGEGER